MNARGGWISTSARIIHIRLYSRDLAHAKLCMKLSEERLDKRTEKLQETVSYEVQSSV